jgi:hypothetical protein
MWVGISVTVRVTETSAVLNVTEFPVTAPAGRDRWRERLGAVVVCESTQAPLGALTFILELKCSPIESKVKPPLLFRDRLDIAPCKVIGVELARMWNQAKRIVANTIVYDAYKP